MAGLFIVFEGIDGSGKTEQTARLVDWLQARDQRVLATREPTDGVFGRRYRAWGRGEIEATPEEVLDFFLEDRREHVAQRIGPALSAGEIVVCDRYVASTLAYEVSLGVDRGLLHERVGSAGFPDPDLVLWLRLPVEQALERIGKRAVERFERAAFLERVDREYLALGLDPIDASRGPDEVAHQVRERVSGLLADHADFA